MEKTTLSSLVSAQNFILILFSSILFLGCQKSYIEDADFIKNKSFLKKIQIAEKFSKIHKMKTTRDLIANAIYQKGIEEIFLFKLVVNSKLVKRDGSILDSLIQQNPTLTVAYPSFAFIDETLEAHLDSIEYYVYLDSVPLSNDSIQAIDSSGNEVTISSNFDSNVRYCIIKPSESHIAISSSTGLTYEGESVSDSLFAVFAPFDQVFGFNLYYSDDVMNAQFIEDGNYFGENLTGPGNPSDPGDPNNDPCIECTEQCERDCLDGKDYLHRVKFGSIESVKQFESGWYLPTIELRVHYAMYNIPTTSTLQITKKVDKHWRAMTVNNGHQNWPARLDGWSDPINIPIVRWDKSHIAELMSVNFIEADNRLLGGKLKVPIKFKVEEVVEAGIEYEVEFGRGDKQIGDVLVDYCDEACNEGETYKIYDYQSNPNLEDGFWYRQRRL